MLHEKAREVRKQVKDSNITKLNFVVARAIEMVALKKAQSNCLGLMYEPKKPESITKIISNNDLGNIKVR